MKRPPRVDTRVRFVPSPASYALYSMAPAINTIGTVTTVSFGRHRSHYMPGPGGGLLYVKWPTGILGVSLLDVEKV